MYLLTNTRLFQSDSDIKRNEFTLFNNITHISLTLNNDSAELVKLIFTDTGKLKSCFFLIFPSVRFLLKTYQM